MAQDTDNNPCETDGVAHQHALTLRRVLDHLDADQGVTLQAPHDLELALVADLDPARTAEVERRATEELVRGVGGLIGDAVGVAGRVARLVLDELLVAERVEVGPSGGDDRVLDVHQDVGEVVVAGLEVGVRPERWRRGVDAR